jgi:hypothetical protein
MMQENKILGMWLSSVFDMAHAADRQRGAVMAAWREVFQQAHEHELRHMPHAMLHLVQTYVLPAALCGSQVWGPDLLSMRSLSPPLFQKAMSHSLCHIAYVCCTSSVTLVEEHGEHCQFY